jgi:indolepyruvate ferredoxin oxidoreductase beta subunit
VKSDIVVTGVGGQGIVVFSDILCEAALIDGFDVAKAEIHGMAQRGGSTIAYVRIGEKVPSPLIERGKSDIIVGFEMLETARALPMLKENGTVIMNKQYIPPSVSMKERRKPMKPHYLIDLIGKRAAKLFDIDGTAIAYKLGSNMVVNIVLLGALSALPENPVKQESFQQAIASRLKQKYVDLNIRAFQLGRESVLLS